MIQIKHRFTRSVLCEFDVETIKEAVEEAVSRGYILRCADLRGTNLRGVDLNAVDLSGADLSTADLFGANLFGTNLRGANLFGTNLFGTDLRGTDLSGADLSTADLFGTNLFGTNLRGANLFGTNLFGTDLRGTDLFGANLSNTNLFGTDLFGEKIAIAPIIISGLNWDICISESYLKIGCQRHSHKDWAKFDDDEIAVMHENAMAFWKANKSWIMAACKEHRKQSLAYRKANLALGNRVTYLGEAGK